VDQRLWTRNQNQSTCVAAGQHKAGLDVDGRDKTRTLDGAYVSVKGSIVAAEAFLCPLCNYIQSYLHTKTVFLKIVFAPENLSGRSLAVRARLRPRYSRGPCAQAEVCHIRTALATATTPTNPPPPGLCARTPATSFPSSSAPAEAERAFAPCKSYCVSSRPSACIIPRSPQNVSRPPALLLRASSPPAPHMTNIHADLLVVHSVFLPCSSKWPTLQAMGASALLAKNLSLFVTMSAPSSR